MLKTILVAISFIVLSALVRADGPLFPNKDIKVSYECGCEKSYRCQYTCSEFNRLFNISRKVYAYWDLKQKKYNFSFEEEAQKFASQIRDEMTESEISQLFISWSDLYRDGHVTARICDLKAHQFVNPPFYANVINAGTNSEVVYIHSSNDPVFEKFDVIKTVIFNDLIFSISDWLDKNEKAGSSKAMRRRSSVRSLFRGFGDNDDRIQLIVERNGEELDPITVVQVAKQFEESKNSCRRQPSQTPSTPPTEEQLMGKEFVKFEILPDRIGYLKIDQFSGFKMHEYLDQLIVENAANFSSLIIDLRYNGGGNPAGDALLAHMTKERISRYKTKVRWSDVWLANKYRGYASVELSPYEVDWTKIQPKRFMQQENPLLTDKKIVVLSGPRCFSACDTFMHGIKTHKFATIIGQAAGGGTGTPEAWGFYRDNIQFRMSVEYGINNNGETIEGNPVQPDIVVLDDLESVKQSVDKTLIAAVEFLQEGSMKPGSERDQMQREFQVSELPYRLPEEDPYFDEPSTERYQ